MRKKLNHLTLTVYFDPEISEDEVKARIEKALAGTDIRLDPKPEWKEAKLIEIGDLCNSRFYLVEREKIDQMLLLPPLARLSFLYENIFPTEVHIDDSDFFLDSDDVDWLDFEMQLKA